MVLSKEEIERRINDSYELSNNVIIAVPEPLVTVRTSTYQHSTYIKDCIEGVLMQETSFPIEFIIGEDFSTDGTREIVFDYANKYPDIIRVITADYNVGSKANGRRCIKASRGKYMALCEGDDYWTDPLKLQKQVEFLEQNPDCTLIFHSVRVVSAINKQSPFSKRNDNKSRFFSMEELIMGGGGFISTPTIMFSTNMLLKRPSWSHNAIVGDYLLVLIAGANGYVYYLDEEMAVYRKDVPNSVTVKRDLLSFDDFIDRSIKLMQMLISFDAYTSYKYTKTIKLKISDYIFNQIKKRSDADLFQLFFTYRKIKKYLLPKEKKGFLRLVLFHMRGFSTIYNIARFFKQILASIFNLYFIKKIFKNYNSIRHDIKPPEKTFLSDDRHTFFGYYDITPFDSTENKVLAIQVDLELTTPISGRMAEVGYFETFNRNPKFIKIGQTESWNWQQGCRLQWYPPDNDKTIFYNKLIGNNYGAVVQELISKKVIHSIRHSIYDLDKTGNWGLSLNFSRLQRLRPGYGYINLFDNTINDYCPKNDGVWLIDIKKDHAQLLFSFADLAAIMPHDSMKNAHHYINHLSFNPSSNSFMFFHLWHDSFNKRYSRLFTASKEGDRLSLLNNSGHVSHYTWLSNDKLLVTTYVAPKKLRYCLYDQMNRFEGIVGNEQLTSDGHPTYIRSGNLLITDTYPDEFRDQKLLLFNSKTNKKEIINRYYSPHRFNKEVRCDLHPRPSPSGKKLSIDVVVNKKRAMKVLDISSIG